MPSRYVVELYEVTNWTDPDPANWDLAADTWAECDSRRIVFYDGRRVPDTLISKWMAREANINSGGHGWYDVHSNFSF